MRSPAEGLAVLELRDVGLTAMFWGQRLGLSVFWSNIFQWRGWSQT